MTLNAVDLSTHVFIRGLTNLKAQLTAAEAHVAASGLAESALLDARLGGDSRDPASYAPADLHGYTLAAQVHWAAEGALLAIAQLLATARVPGPGDAKSFADLHQRLDAAIAELRAVAPADLEAGLGRPIVITTRGGSTEASGQQFLVAFAIPHFYYHLTSAYGILRNQGVRLTMGDFLGAWGSN